MISFFKVVRELFGFQRMKDDAFGPNPIGRFDCLQSKL
jgi:hypothetical protein